MRLLAVLLLAPLAPALACRVDLRAEVPIEVGAGHILVPALIDGRALTFILDTGAQRTLIAEAAAARLGLRRDEWVATTMRGVGGDVRRRNALPRSLTVGGMALRHRSAAADLSLVVADLPTDIAGRPIAGLLGADLLAGMDLDIDLPHRTLRLFGVGGCSGDFVPWPQPHVAIPAVQPVRDVLLVGVALDGAVLRAQLDTGAASTAILAPGIDRLQLAPGSAGPSVGGVGRDQVPSQVHRFSRLQVGPVIDVDRDVLSVRAFALRIVDMLLGADWLANRRVWVSYATSQLFVSPP